MNLKTIYKSILSENNDRYTELEFVCQNSSSTTATDPRSQLELFKDLKKLASETDGAIIPYMQDFSKITDHTEKSLAVIFFKKDIEKELKRKVLALAKKHNVKVDLESDKSYKFVIDVIRGDLEYLVESTVKITDIIKKLTPKYIKKWGSITKVNAGGCEDFADEVAKLFGNHKIVINDGVFWDDEYNKKGDKWVECAGDSYNLSALKRYNSFPKKPMDYEYQMPGHTWIFHNNKHYDVEVPEGVTTIWEMPIFKRSL